MRRRSRGRSVSHCASHVVCLVCFVRFLFRPMASSLALVFVGYFKGLNKNSKAFRN